MPAKTRSLSSLWNYLNFFWPSLQLIQFGLLPEKETSDNSSHLNCPRKVTHLSIYEKQKLFSVNNKQMLVKDRLIQVDIDFFVRYQATVYDYSDTLQNVTLGFMHESCGQEYDAAVRIRQ